MMKRFIACATVLLVGLMLLPTPARADGLMLINGVYRQPAISHINVVIADKIATTTLEQTFRNDLDKAITASYVAPVPPGATITSFAQLVDGTWQEADVKSSVEAEKEFAAAAADGQKAAIASGQVNPAQPVASTDPLMTFQTRLNLPPNAERKVRLVFTEVLTGPIGLTRYTYHLDTTALSDEPIGDLLLNVSIADKSEIRAVYSPTHKEAEIARPDGNSATLVYRAQNVVPTQDFELVFTQSADKFGLSLASYREKDTEDGYFVLIAAPQLKADSDEVIQKDFVFILDRSSSMDGDKFEQARKALLRILDALNEGDRFTVIAFNQDVQPFSSELLPLAERGRARQWVESLNTDSGTNIHDALAAGLNTVDQSSARPHIVVFLTDGQATVGVTETSAILSAVRTQIRAQSRLYTIGIGDVNQPLLEALARENRGRELFLSATEPLEKPISAYYESIDSPVLVDLALDFGGMQVYDVYPDPLPDMFLGGQVVVAGRYKGSGDVTVTLRGNINGQPHVSTYKAVRFLAKAADARPNAFVPRLWAQQKIDRLVRTIQLEGATKARVDEVTELGLRYRLVTPYTSFVVTDKQAKQPKQPALPQTGLPFLYVDDYRTVNTALLAAGALLSLISLVGLIVSRRRPARR